MSAPKLLEGVRVLDLTSIVFGPYCTQTLADMGAEVIKIESPQGDPMRMSGHFAVTCGMGAPHMTLNRGKRSVVLDLKTDLGKAAMRALLERSDIFVHNIRGKPMARLGFDYAAVRALNSALVYLHCVGFGSGGPYADLPAYDDVIQAASGLTTLHTRVDGDPRPLYMPSTIVDKVAGLHAAYAALAAYTARLRTGLGQFVEVPMFETFTHFLLEEHLSGGTFDPPRGTIGYRRQLEPDRQPFRTSDGYISIVPYGDDNWIKLFAVMERSDILGDSRFATAALRTQNVEHLYRTLGDLTPARSTADWLERLRAAGIPAMPVRDVADIMADPHLVATGFFRRRQHPSEGGYIEMTPPVHFSSRPVAAVAPAPQLGQHTQEILAELGLGESTVAAA